MKRLVRKNWDTEWNIILIYRRPLSVTRHGENRTRHKTTGRERRREIYIFLQNSDKQIIFENFFAGAAVFEWKKWRGFAFFFIHLCRLHHHRPSLFIELLQWRAQLFFPILLFFQKLMNFPRWERGLDFPLSEDRDKYSMKIMFINIRIFKCRHTSNTTCTRWERENEERTEIPLENLWWKTGKCEREERKFCFSSCDFLFCTELLSATIQCLQTSCLSWYWIVKMITARLTIVRA